MLRARLPHNRRQAGTLELLDQSGQVLHRCPCLGLADQLAAAGAGNPQRDPTRQYGDTPAGRYRVTLGRVLEPARSYGPGRVLVLDPLDGQARQAAANGRSGLLIHGGDPSPAGGLRPTHGCLRVSNHDQARLAELLEGAGAITLELEAP